MLTQDQRAFIDSMPADKLVVFGCKRCDALWYEPAEQALREDHFCPRCVADIYLIGSADTPKPIVFREFRATDA